MDQYDSTHEEASILISASKINRYYHQTMLPQGTFCSDCQKMAMNIQKDSQMIWEELGKVKLLAEQYKNQL